MYRELEMLEERVMRLECQNRLLKWLSAVLIAMAMVGATGAQTGGNLSTSSQKFELRDGAGHLRAELAILNGGPALRFFGPDGRVESLVTTDVFTIFSDKTGDNVASYGKDFIEFDDNRGNELLSLTGQEKDQMGKISLNDYKNGIYTTITPKDLQKLRAGGGQ
jgi:hypothetical protein